MNHHYKLRLPNTPGNHTAADRTAEELNKYGIKSHVFHTPYVADNWTPYVASFRDGWVEPELYVQSETRTPAQLAALVSLVLLQPEKARK